MSDPPTQSHMAIEVGGQNVHMGCPIPKPVLSTELEPLHHWRYQLTLMLYSGKGGFRPLGNICKGDLGEAGMWLSWQSACLAPMKPWAQPLPLQKAGYGGTQW